MLGLLPQPHCPWVSLVVLFPPLHLGRPRGFAPEAALEGLGLPVRRAGVELGRLLGSQGVWQHQVLRGAGGSGAGNVVSGRGWQPGSASTLQCSCLGTRSLTEKPGRPQATGSQRVGHDEATLRAQTKTSQPAAALPLRAEREGGAAAWLRGPRRRLRRRSCGPIRVFQPLVAADQEASLDSLSPELHRFRHIEGPGWVLLCSSVRQVFEGPAYCSAANAGLWGKRGYGDGSIP